MAIRRVDIIGSSLPILRDVGEGEDNSDYRPVPKSDEGNEGYEDRGYLGWYAPDNREPFRDPPDVRYFTGYGATEEDLRLGYCKPDVGNEPAYAKSNYEMRSTLPRARNEDFGNTDTLPDDFEFRSRNQRSRGFLTRPRIPTER